MATPPEIHGGPSPHWRSTRESVLILMQSRENCRLLAEWLEPQFNVLVSPDGRLPDASFDMCILDGPSLESLREEIQALKRNVAPVYLPFLFVTWREDLRLVTRFLYKAVDEMILLPIEKIELAARMENLLKARRGSVALMRQSNDLFTAIVEQSLVGVYLGRDGHFTYFNQAGADMFGYRPEAITGGLSPLDLVHPDDHELVAEQIRSLEQGRVASVHYEFRGVRQDGAMIRCEVFERVVSFEGLPHRLGALLDVTERLELEHERIRHKESQIEMLQRADLMKDQFLSILSHELRTPLNAILGFGSILTDDLAGPLNARQNEYVEKMMAGAEVLLALIGDLLDMSRIQAGKFSLTIERFEPASVAREVVERLEALGETRGIELELSLGADLPEVEGDPQRLAQVLTNLVGNALKFTPAGGHVHVTLRSERNTLYAEVADTGVGIAPSDLDRLFQPFSQLDMSTTRSQGGTGLGLSISKAIVEAHGGQIGVRSTPGEGSTFWFTLPFRAARGAQELGTS